ncbi:MAG: glycosyltransferase [Candidatus Omnitrophica bacterium]|nr:glycosyltransferase [Candidatus Omnitrophota bacterium]
MPELLRSIRRTALADYELIVVDDCSTDNTAALIRQAGGQTLIRLPQRSGPSRARNVGASRARGDILVFVDADVILPEQADLLKEMCAVLRDCAEVSGVATLSDVRPVVENAIAYNNSIYQKYYAERLLAGKERVVGRVPFFSTRLGAIRKNIFQASGGFDENLGWYMTEDGEFWLRCCERGYVLCLDRSFVHYHRYPFTFRKYIRSYLRAAYSRYFIGKTYRTRHDPSVSAAERVRRLLAFSLFCWPLSQWWLSPSAAATLGFGLLIALYCSFGKMGALVRAHVPRKYRAAWYAVYVFITPYIIGGYCAGLIAYWRGKRLLRQPPSDLDFFSA